MTKWGFTSDEGEAWGFENTKLGTIRLTDLENDMTGGAIAPDERDRAEKQKVRLFDGFPRPEKAANHAMKEIVPSSAVSLTLRVVEARVAPVGHAVPVLAPV